MARKPKSRPTPAAAVKSDRPDRDRIVDAMLALLAERPFEDIGLAQVATAADVSLAAMRGEFGSTLAVLAAFIKDIDRQVLSGGDEDMAEELPRERLFDVLMRRLELLNPHKEAIRSLLRSVSRNPGLALALNGMAVRSQQWMLTAADIEASGPKGMVRAQGLALLFAKVLRVWIDDEDEGLARTLAALDRELARGQRFAGLLDGLFRIPERACQFRGRLRRSRRDRDSDEPAAA